MGCVQVCSTGRSCHLPVSQLHMSLLEVEESGPRQPKKCLNPSEDSTTLKETEDGYQPGDEAILEH